MLKGRIYVTMGLVVVFILAFVIGYNISKHEGRTENIVSVPFLMSEGTYIDYTTGQEITSTEGVYCASTYIPVLGISELTLCSSTEGDVAGYAFYDDSFAYVAGDGMDANGDELEAKILEVPDKASYIRFSCLGNKSEEASLTYTCEFAEQQDVNVCFAEGGYSKKTGLRDNIQNYACTNILLAKETYGYLQGLLFAPEGFYISLYNGNEYVGYIQDGVKYNQDGAQITDIMYSHYTVSFDITPGYGQPNYVSNIYLDYGKSFEKNIYVASIVELQSALEEASLHANPTLLYNIHLFPGVYDVFSNIDLSTISGSGDTVGNRGLELPPYTNLYGRGNTTIVLSIPEELTPQYSTIMSTLNLNGGECCISNINFVCENARYCIHDDAITNVGQTVVFDNCSFTNNGHPNSDYINKSYCYGAGKYGNGEVHFKNCVFRQGEGEGEWAGVYVHTHPIESMYRPCKVEIDNCSFEGDGTAIILQSPWETIDYPLIASINNTFFKEGETIVCSGVKPMRLFGGGNSEVSIINESDSDIHFVK